LLIDFAALFGDDAGSWVEVRELWDEEERYLPCAADVI